MTPADRSFSMVSTPMRMGQAQARRTRNWLYGNQVGVIPAGAQVFFGLVQIFMEERQKILFVGGGEQGLRAKVSSWLQFFHGQVAAAFFQVRRQIAQDVDELQAFAEADAVHEETIFVEFCVRKHMGAAHPGPKFAHAAGDAIGVVVQFGGGFEGDDLAGG